MNEQSTLPAVTDPKSSAVELHQEIAPVTRIDAAQARVDGVANMLFKAYEKASTLELTPEEVAKLTADFPDDAVMTGAGGDANLLYIQHSSIRRRLAQVFAPGQWTLINRRTWLDEVAGFMYAECVLIIRGCFIGEAIGAQRYSAKNARLNYSDSVEGAQSEALRRIAGKYLDCGIQVWDKTYCNAWKERQKAPPQQPKAKAQEPPKPAPVVTEATPAHRSRMIANLLATGIPASSIQEYAVKSGIIHKTQDAEKEWPLAHTPRDKESMINLTAKVKAFINGEPIDTTP